MFNPESLFWRIISRMVDFVGLSLFWAALSLPVVTIGPATAALYYTVVKAFRQGETSTFTTMWRSFRENCRRGIPATLICVPFCVLLFYGHSVMAANIDTSLGVILYMIYYIVLVIPFGAVCYLFPLMGRFELGLKDLVRTAFSLTLYHLPSSIILVLMTLEMIVWTMQKWAPIFIVPTGWALVSSWFMEKNFAKHLNEEDVARLENRMEETDEH